ncbi:MAG: DUF429 domain-containing protein [Archaeoglobaceae archaeon]
MGIRRSVAAVLRGCRIVWIGDYEDLSVEVKYAGIDAPLSSPAEGNFRECERKLQRMGIPLFPLNVEFIRKVSLRGMEIAEELKGKGVEVFEVYPYATRVILGIAPGAKKTRKEGLRRILEDLRKFVDVPELSHDEVDAVIAALTVKLYVSGDGFAISGRDGTIIVPSPAARRRADS